MVQLSQQQLLANIGFQFLQVSAGLVLPTSCPQSRGSSTCQCRRMERSLNEKDVAKQSLGSRRRGIAVEPGHSLR